ncbi:cysteine-rich DPF motif domain-containing protein 1 [Anopheles ziemanni]|uniref:cysteine-rich DPF motif domain-containing protein 1 n=1 Tax=Anopheles coustani TaxID=139045 RepID=UPI002657E424|nr:cysteine-rich DPF motif domain-containing protein 1 [Anopheles coustani]XP_058172013.1 cysteine-rich DPF motif domain-containing protein 1 [Anopheles ziemanni]
MMTAKPSSTEEKIQDKQTGAPETPAIPSIAFRCELCGLNESCDYRGRRPPFAAKIELPEDCYVMRDPFAPPPSAVPDKPASEHYLILGADCNLCRRTVCKATECSFFYGATFCRRCSMERVVEFPLEVRSKIKKQFA